MTPARRFILRRAARLAAALALALALAAPLPAAGLATEAAAMSPLPFFQRVERVGLLCAVDTADGTTTADLAADLAADVGETALCGRAAAVLAGLLASGPAVTPLTPNDDRIADRATLLVLVHATLRREDGRRLLALAATLQRTGSGSDAPFFMTPPQALALSGGLEEPVLDQTLRRLFTPLAGALRANP